MKAGSPLFNAYQVLGVSKNATPEEIRKAYLDLAKVWHPDVCDAENAQEKFQELQSAYSILKEGGIKDIYEAIEAAEASRDALAQYRKQQAERRAAAKRRRGRNFGGGGGLFR